MEKVIIFTFEDLQSPKFDFPKKGLQSPIVAFLKDDAKII